jgi:hypothetical protein
MADTQTKTKWHYKGDYLEFCSCAYGCPCNFNGFPTHGYCRAVVAYKLSEGKCGDVDLAGATFAMGVSWPKAIHEGNGTAAVFFDSSMTKEQQEALVGILTNQHGGLPHEIFAATFTNILGPFVEPIEVEINGTKSSVKVGNKISAAMTPHTSPIEPYEEQEVHLVLPTGFVFTDADAARTTGQKVDVDGLQFEDKDSNAFHAKVEHSNDTPARSEGERGRSPARH